MNDTDRVYTFVVDHLGGTYCAQIAAATVEAAIEAYNETDPSGVELGNLSGTPAPLEGMAMVWYDSGLDDQENLIGATIIQTAHTDHIAV